MSSVASFCYRRFHRVCADVHSACANVHSVCADVHRALTRFYCCVALPVLLLPLTHPAVCGHLGHFQVVADRDDAPLTHAGLCAKVSPRSSHGRHAARP